MTCQLDCTNEDIFGLDDSELFILDEMGIIEDIFYPEDDETN